MDFTLDNAVQAFYDTVQRQNNCWNLYLIVGFGMLAYLGAIEAQSSLIWLSVICFASFSVSNLIFLCYLHSHLLVISRGIRSYLNRYPEKVPDEFHGILMNVTAKPMWAHVLLHILSTTAFSVALVVAGNISPSSS